MRSFPRENLGKYLTEHEPWEVLSFLIRTLVDSLQLKAETIREPIRTDVFIISKH